MRPELAKTYVLPRRRGKMIKCSNSALTIRMHNKQNYRIKYIKIELTSSDEVN